jgi:hypothetical protein
MSKPIGLVSAPRHPSPARVFKSSWLPEEAGFQVFKWREIKPAPGGHFRSVRASARRARPARIFLPTGQGDPALPSRTPVTKALLMVIAPGVSLRGADR